MAMIVSVAHPREQQNLFPRVAVNLSLMKILASSPIFEIIQMEDFTLQTILQQDKV